MTGGALDGRVGLVNRLDPGIGRAIAERFAQEGGHVVAHGRSAQDAEMVAAENFAGDTTGLAADLTGSGPPDELIERTVHWKGRPQRSGEQRRHRGGPLPVGADPSVPAVIEEVVDRVAAEHGRLDGPGVVDGPTQGYGDGWRWPTRTGTPGQRDAFTRCCGLVAALTGLTVTFRLVPLATMAGTRHDDDLKPRPMQRPGGRTEKVRQRVVAATTAILATEGVPGVTIDAVASRSGVSRTTIYRRWRTPELLMLEALREELGPRAARVDDTGSFRGDIKALLGAVHVFVTSEQGRGIMQAVFIRPESADIDAAVQPYWAQRFEAAGEMVRRAKGRGELPADADERFILELAVAPVYFKIFLTRESIDDQYLDRLVDFVLIGCGAVGQPPGETTDRERHAP